MNKDTQGAIFTAQQMMRVSASRRLTNTDVCLVGIGEPSVACNLARLTHAPQIKLIYESGTIDAKPDILPLSIGDGVLCHHALTIVSLPEIFQYWLQAGRISVGFLGGAQIDRFANLNTSVIGDYHRPKVRLPGAGGAPEIATGCDRIFIIMKMTPQKFVEKLDFRTTLGFGDGGDHRRRLGIQTQGPVAVITDLCIWEPHAHTKELEVVSLYPGVRKEQVCAACQWEVRFSPHLVETPPPTDLERTALLALEERTQAAYKRKNN